MQKIRYNDDNLSEENRAWVMDASYRSINAAMAQTQGTVSPIEGPWKLKTIPGSRYGAPISPGHSSNGKLRICACKGVGPEKIAGRRGINLIIMNPKHRIWDSRKGRLQK